MPFFRLVTPFFEVLKMFKPSQYLDLSQVYVFRQALSNNRKIIPQSLPRSSHNNSPEDDSTVTNIAVHH